jgi:hypothetical protein
MGNPGVTERFAKIYGMLEARCDMYVSMTKLSGRLDLLGCQIVKGEEEPEEYGTGAAVFYQEGDESEADDELRQEVLDEMVDSASEESCSDDDGSEVSEGSASEDDGGLIDREAMEVDGSEAESE